MGNRGRLDEFVAVIQLASWPVKSSAYSQPLKRQSHCSIVGPVSMQVRIIARLGRILSII